MSVYSIKDLEHLSGIKAHTLRIWEQRYNIISPKRTDTNIRLYNDVDLKLVLNISLLKDHGFKISEIAKMTVDDMTEEVRTITEKKLLYPDQIQALTLAMIDLDEDRFEKIMSVNILQQGFELTMINIIFPFLTKIGLLWQTGAISPAHEHFITYLIRQKLMVAIDGQMPSKKAHPKKYMLFLPDGELHEISLLFANFLLRSRQNKVIYLGQSLPFHDLCGAYDIHKPQYLFSIITSTPSHHEVQPYVAKLAAQLPQAHILLTGYQVVAQDIDSPANVTILKSIGDMIDFIEAHE